jgi:hypothetical protein
VAQAHITQSSIDTKHFSAWRQNLLSAGDPWIASRTRSRSRSTIKKGYEMNIPLRPISMARVADTIRQKRVIVTVFISLAIVILTLVVNFSPSLWDH